MNMSLLFPEFILKGRASSQACSNRLKVKVREQLKGSYENINILNQGIKLVLLSSF